jgi:hypothetical protein
MDQTMTFHICVTNRPPMLELVGRGSGQAGA